MRTPVTRLVLFAISATVLALAGLFIAAPAQEAKPAESPATEPAAPLPGPGGTIVYYNLTGRNAGPQWTQSPYGQPDVVQPLREEGSPRKPDRKCFGTFVNQTARLALKDLPSHKYVRVSFDLMVFWSWDGNDRVNAGNMPIGPDHWKLAVDGGPTLLNTTFCNTPECSNVQAYPDDFPFGNHTGQTGASERATLGCTFGTQDLDAVYKLSFAFPHTGNSIKLDFSAFGLQGGGDETWGLTNVVVETLEESPAAKLTPKQIADLVAGLEDKDPLKAHESVLALMCAGDAAVRAIQERFGSATSRPGGAETERTEKAEKYEKLIADLGADEWKTRSAATEALKEEGLAAVPALRKALRATTSAEVRLRLQNLLEGVRDVPVAYSQRDVVLSRAARALQVIGTEKAKAVLEGMDLPVVPDENPQETPEAE